MLPTVCVLAAFCAGAGRAAPTVTYDQRQQGEFNLQVQLDDVTVVLVGADGAGEMFAAQRNGPAVQQQHHRIPQLLQRFRGAVGPRKKHKKPVAATNCTAAAEKPTPVDEKPTPVDETAAGYERPPQQPTKPAESAGYERPDAPPAPVSESADRPAAVDVQDGEDADTGDDAAASRPVASSYADGSPSSSPSSSSLSSSSSSLTSSFDAEKYYDPYAVTPGTPVVSRNEAVVMVPVPTVEKPGATEEIPADVPAAVSPTSTAADATITGPVPADAKTENTSAEKTGEASDAKVAAAPKPAADGAWSPAGGEPAEKSSANNVQADRNEANGSVGKTEPATKEAGVQTSDKHNAAVETVTAEKSVQAEPSRTVNNPAAAAVTAPGVTAADTVDSDGKSVEETVASGAAQATAGPSNDDGERVKSAGITASTKPVDIKEDKKNAPSNKPAAETVATKSSLKPTAAEMVVVKTVERPATITSVKTATTVKTVGSPPKTSNGSAIVRKVADRNPLPSITLDVATPKVVNAQSV